MAFTKQYHRAYLFLAQYDEEFSPLAMVTTNNILLKLNPFVLNLTHLFLDFYTP